MPYEGELASALGHVPVMQVAQEITRTMGRWRRLRDVDNTNAARQLCHDASSLPSGAPYDLVVAVDGSPAYIEVVEGCYVGFYHIGTASIQVADYLGSANAIGHPVDGNRLRRSVSTNHMTLCLPTGGFVIGRSDEADSWRDELYRQFSQPAYGGRSLVDAIMLLAGGPGKPAPAVTLARCPVCGARDLAVPSRGASCACEARLYPTDVLRTVEYFVPGTGGAAAVGWAGAAAERLLLILYLEQILEDGGDMSHMLLMADGPLAFFGHAKPMKAKLLDYWSQFSRLVPEAESTLPTIVGVEKTGTWVEASRTFGLKAGQFIMPDNDLIVAQVRRRRISQVTPYGAGEYYGRHVVYRSVRGDYFVLTIMRPSGAPYTVAAATDEADPASYPDLGRVLNAVEAFGSVTTPGALIPIMEAHRASAIPLDKYPLLQALARQGAGLPENCAEV